MFLILRTFDDVLGAMRRAGGSLSGSIVLADARVVRLEANEVDPQIEIEVREGATRSESTPIRKLPPEEQLRRIGEAGGSLG